MAVSKDYLHPEAIQRLGRMELRAQRIVDGFLTGIHRNRHFGQSIEFRQHRDYVAGDDLRRVDWQVWGRQDRLYVRQYEAETNLRAYLLVDVSSSMHYGSGAMTKQQYASTAAAALAFMLLRQQDAVGCMTFADEVVSQLPPRTQSSHLAAIVRTMTTATEARKSDLGKVLQQAAQSFSRSGLMILISDLFCDVERTLRGLRMLRQRGHQCLVLHVLDDDELEFSFTGPTVFEGLEESAQLRCDPRSLRVEYLRAMDAFRERMRHGCAAAAVDYQLIRTSEPLDAALAHLVARQRRCRSA